MDWNLFWTAFGAIGTTVGSITTAMAVLVAVKQYLQPIEKRIVLAHGLSFPVMYDNSLGETQIHIDIKNKGIREMTISSVYIRNKKTKFLLNKMQSNVNPINLPYILKPEESISFLINYDNFVHEMNEFVKKGLIRNKEKLIFCIQDMLGEMHNDKKKITINNGKIK